MYRTKTKSINKLKTWEIYDIWMQFSYYYSRQWTEYHIFYLNNINSARKLHRFFIVVWTWLARNGVTLYWNMLHRGEIERAYNLTHTPYSICNEKNLKLKANQTINCHTLVKIVTLFKVLIAFYVAAKCVTCKMHDMQRWKNWVKQEDRQTEIEWKILIWSNLKMKNEYLQRWCSLRVRMRSFFFFCGRRIPVKYLWNSVT